MGCREPSCAKYLTLCADLPKVRFELGAYGFSHAGVLLSALPAVGILIKKGALLPLFPLSPSLSKAQVPPPLLPSLFLVHPLHYWNRNATQQERVERERETLERKGGLLEGARVKEGPQTLEDRGHERGREKGVSERRRKHSKKRERESE